MQPDTADAIAPICPWCKNEFKPVRPWQTFCNTHCQQEHHKARRAEKEAGTAKGHRQLVLDAVKNYPNHTSAELAKITGLDRVAVSRRLPDLVKIHNVVCCGVDEKRVCTVTKKRCFTWRVDD
jgi:predicted HTH transcriptional regulator